MCDKDLILSSLFDLCQQHGISPPIYVQFPNLDSTGEFTCRCDVTDHSETGHGASKKIATRNAARKMFSYLKGQKEAKGDMINKIDSENNIAMVDGGDSQSKQCDTSQVTKQTVKIDVLSKKNVEDIVSFFQRLKASCKPTIVQLHKEPISDPHSQLKHLCEEEGLELSYDDDQGTWYDNNDDGNTNNNLDEEWQSVVRVSTLFVFCGNGSSAGEAREVAARCALMYLKLMTRSL